MKKHPKHPADFVYFFAESKIESPPQDMKAGFTDSDVIDVSGFYLFKKNGEVISGCTYTIEEFFSIINDLSLQNRIIYRIDEMRRMIHLDDDFLEMANEQWVTIHKDPQLFGIQRVH